MKKINLIISLVATTLLGISLANATVHIVTAYSTPNEKFDPSVVNAVCGDTIKWMNGNGVHTTVSNSVPNGAASWSSPSNGLPSSGFIYVVTIAGTYTYNCHPQSGGHMPASIVVTCSTGIPAVEVNHISSAYPNPFDTKIIFEAKDADMIILYNILGEKIKSVSLERGETKVEMDVATLSKGIYFYSIIKDEMIVGTRKLVKN